MEKVYSYIIVGAGLAGVSAIDGIRELDTKGEILVLGLETDFPYDRPPLTKQLWSGKMKVDEVFLRDKKFYESQGVELLQGERVSEIFSAKRQVHTASGKTFTYQKLLLATGGTPRKLTIPGGQLEGLCYFRTLFDYSRIHKMASAGSHAVVIGGGFIGAEIAAALCMNKVQVTMIFPEDHLVNRVFPASLGQYLTSKYKEKGVHLWTQDVPVAIEQNGSKYIVKTRTGKTVESDLVIVGIGIVPSVELAKQASLSIENGISVNRYLQTSDPLIFAAGDNAFFPYLALGRNMRVEHWDNALSQGKCAGRNMVKVSEPYNHMPFFYSDLFEFGYEAVGDVDARLETHADWEKENDTGTVYYLLDGKIRGVMMCNVWGKIDEARSMIQRGERISNYEPKRLKG